MSFRRKTYDGDLFGGSTGTAERGNTLGSEGPFNKFTSPGRAGKDNGLLEEEHALFSEDGDKDRYLITYADLITLLLGLFIILYAISNVDLEKYQKMVGAVENVLGISDKSVIIKAIPDKNAEIRKKFEEVEKLKGNLQNVINTNEMTNSIQLEENERGITIHILDDILFSPGNAEIGQGSAGILNKLAAVIKTLPNDVRVEGHTDNIPINSSQYQSNWHLSVARALNTAYYLINSQGLSPEKVSIVGYSEYHPVKSNETPEGRRSNRRVDIVILKK